MSTFEHTENGGVVNDAFVASPQPPLAIAHATDLLVEAAGFSLLRALRWPGSRDYRYATDELEKFLVLARVACANALSSLEE